MAPSPDAIEWVPTRKWRSGSASPCQGEGRGFESRRPLGEVFAVQGLVPVEWPRGEATACKAVYTGSNPVSTSQDSYGTTAYDSTGDWRSLASALP